MGHTRLRSVGLPPRQSQAEELLPRCRTRSPAHRVSSAPVVEVDPREANDLHGSIYSKFIAKLRIDFAQVSPLRELLPDRLLVKLVRFIGFEFDFVLEFTADDHVNFVAKPVTLALASELKPACVRDFGENGKAVAPISRHSRAAPPAFFGYELNRTLERYRREASLASGTPISLRGVISLDYRHHKCWSFLPGGRSRIRFAGVRELAEQSKNLLGWLQSQPLLYTRPGRHGCTTRD